LACCFDLTLLAAASEPLTLTFHLVNVGLVKDYTTKREQMQKRLRITGKCMCLAKASSYQTVVFDISHSGHATSSVIWPMISKPP
jgi:hypothetical protein